MGKHRKRKHEDRDERDRILRKIEKLTKKVHRFYREPPGLIDGKLLIVILFSREALVRSWRQNRRSLVIILWQSISLAERLTA